jgi:hypothetical protein
MKTYDLVFAQLHNPLFLSGKNFKEKLYITGADRVDKMFFDTELKQLLVLYKDSIAVIPESNISSMTPLDAAPFKELFEKEVIAPRPKKTHTSHPMKLNIPSAQVSDPSTQVQNPPMPRTLK